MQSFEYHCPTEIIFGKGAELKAADKIKKYGGTKVLVVYGGGSVVRSGLLQKITDLLQKAELPYETLGGYNQILGLNSHELAYNRQINLKLILF
ncbi:Iron-containing alcohol dehydrogenase [Propionispira arboris]|uniref:Iron-containing alcohol dehydrogenase n=1 Tax=Propionispira arboris TaxID=84035 RepID=A0A1H7CRS3_9FIRM|nr:Iron-containing alcohol dehydrogenase [Propionispira arboris]